jgi:hypothetical protein
VPLHCDVHALIFSDDAVGLETRLHHEFADHRVNLVNLRREFFRVDVPEAAEWRQSETSRRQAAAVTDAP